MIGGTSEPVVAKGLQPGGGHTTAKTTCGRGASQIAWAGCQRSWQGGMRLVDCLGASRVTENVTHGSGRGCWKRSMPDSG
jgi:hypothetical protein